MISRQKGIRNEAVDRGTVKGPPVLLIFFVLFFSIVFFLKLLYSLPLKDSLLWLAGVFIYCYIPGSLLLRSLGTHKDEFFSNLFHSTALGTALMPLLYVSLRRMSHPDLMYPLGLGIFLAWLLFAVRDIRRREVALYTSYPDILSVFILLMMIFVFLHLSHFTNIVFLKDGYTLRTDTDIAFHLGLINTFRDIFPPIYPYASGHGFSYYHLNMHFEIEMFNRLFSIDTLKLTFFYFPLLYFCLLVFLPYIFVRKYLGSRVIGIVTGLLLFGSDLSFIPGLLGMVRPDYPWTIIFNTTIFGLFRLNGYLPALFVLFLSLFYLKQFHEQGKVSHLVVFGLLGYAAYGFKSSMGFHIMGAAFITGVLFLTRRKGQEREGRLLCCASALTMAAMSVDMFLLRGGTGYSIIAFEPFNGFLSSLYEMHITDMSSAFNPLLFPIYVLATLGVRALGLFPIKDILRGKNVDPLVIFLLVFAVSGLLLYEMMYLGAPTMELNNAAWFSAQALMGAWLLLAYFLSAIKNKKKLLTGVALAIALSAPSTIQYLSLRSDSSVFTVDSDSLEVVNYLRKTPPQSVVLHPLDFQCPSLASQLAGRATVVTVFRAFVTNAIGVTEGSIRVWDVRSFFEPASQYNVVDRSFILKKYKVDYVYAPLSHADMLEREPMLFRVIKNSRFVVYKVLR